MELRTFRSLQVPWSAVPLINLGQSDLATGGGGLCRGGALEVKDSSTSTEYSVHSI